jgi:hypothetical protein
MEGIVFSNRLLKGLGSSFVWMRMVNCGRLVGSVEEKLAASIIIAK